MPHRAPDLLLPGENLLPGEFLESSDNRFRLYLETDGSLVALAYSTRGIIRYWRSPAAGPNARLELGRYRYPRRSTDAPAVLLKNAAGAVVWYGSDQPYSAPVWGNHVFAMQSDGNIVHYGRATTTGLVKAVWASDTYHRWERQAVVPPNKPIIEVLGAGTLILAPGQGDTAIVNNASFECFARIDTTVVEIAPRSEISANIPGTVAIETTTYGFRDLHGPDLQSPSRSADNAVALPAPSGRRRVVEYTPAGGLLLRNTFARPIHESLLGETVISGEKLPEPELIDDSEFECKP